jgi:hypothetical protein
MRTIKECRQRAQDCLRLATTATDFFAQDALIRRAAACETMAEALIRQRQRRQYSSRSNRRTTSVPCRKGAMWQYLAPPKCSDCDGPLSLITTIDGSFERPAVRIFKGEKCSRLVMFFL